MDYYVFILGYDLLHDVLDGIECDVAYDFCSNLWDDFCGSPYNDYNRSGYVCLAKYIEAHMDEIKAKLEELR